MTNITRVKKGESIVSGKVLVTCTVTILGIGSHSGTGEEWADDDNGMTSADAQAFKRACSCFGLGRYFYDIQAIWVDLDQNRQPVRTPALFAWALPENWRKGMRPSGRNGDGSSAAPSNGTNGRSQANGSNSPKVSGNGHTAAGDAKAGSASGANGDDLDARILSMEKTVGTVLYRNILREYGRVNQPKLIRDPAVKRTVLQMLESAIRGIERLEAVTRRLDAKTVAASAGQAPSPAIRRDIGHEDAATRGLRPRRTRRFRPTPRSLITTATTNARAHGYVCPPPFERCHRWLPYQQPPGQTRGVDNMSIKAVAHISQVRGGSQARIMLADDGKKYVVKFMGNPQCTRVLANDYLACRLARMIGLSVPEPVIILVDEKTILEQQITFTLAGRAVAARPGLQFGSALVTGAGLGLAARDNAWAGQKLEGICRPARLRQMDRQCRWPSGRIPQGACASGNTPQRSSTLDIASMRASGVSPTLRCGECTGSMMSMSGSNRGTTLLHGCRGSNDSPRGNCSGIADEIPCEWYGERAELQCLLDCLLERRSIVRQLIEGFRTSSRNPFPNWTMERSTPCATEARGEPLAV